jgi:D-alanyl-D-alanine carboxypeptidase/D-alanyl-D-alanine-endopeptidase (penicillin-binding protein 4)
MKIIVVSTFCLFFMNLSFAQDKINTIQQTINHFSEHKELKNAAISFMAYDVENDTILAAYNRKMAIPPASTVKLFTTATALEVLGKDYQPRTKIYQRAIRLIAFTFVSVYFAEN